MSFELLCPNQYTTQANILHLIIMSPKFLCLLIQHNSVSPHYFLGDGLAEEAKLGVLQRVLPSRFVWLLLWVALRLFPLSPVFPVISLSLTRWQTSNYPWLWPVHFCIPNSNTMPGPAHAHIFLFVCFVLIKYVLNWPVVRINSKTWH